jgi:ketosteroid isomerase-like protein
MEEELLKLENAFAEAIVDNDLAGIGRLVADDWIIIDPNGEIVDRTRFFEVIKSGVLTHDIMESEDLRVRVYKDSAVVTAVTRTKGKFMGQEFSTRERATDVFVKRDGRWLCVLTHLTRFPEVSGVPSPRRAGSGRAPYQVQRQILRCLLSAATVIHNED